MSVEAPDREKADSRAALAAPPASGAPVQQPRLLPEARLVAFPRGWPWRALLVTAVLAAVAWPLDQWITQAVTAPVAHNWLVWAFALPTMISFYAVMLAILAALPNGNRLVAGFLSAIFLSAALTHVLKFIIGRARPSLGLGNQSFDFLNWLGQNQSFPSGHSSAAMTLAVLLGLYFPRARWVFYFYALSVGFERIYNNRHFTSDVLAGFVIGAGAVYLSIRLLGQNFYRLERPPRPGRSGG